MLNRSLTDNLYKAWRWFVVGLAFTALVKPERIEAEQAQCFGDQCSDLTTTATFKTLGYVPYTETQLLDYKQFAPSLVESISIKATGEQKKQIQDTLIKICNKNSLKQLVDAGVKIKVLSETEMYKLTKMEEYSGCFVAAYNAIYIHDHVFSEKTQERADQLITILANEISHASIFNKHPKKSTETTEDTFSSLVPWTNAKEKAEFISAYDEFKQNVETYNNLSKMGKNASNEERATLKAFNSAIKSYIPPRLGINASTAKQERLSFVNGQLWITKDNSKAPIKMNEKRIAYLRDCFFAEIQNKEINNLLMHQNKIGIYKGDNNQEFADLLSDFETLSPQMRQTFGPSLCLLLDRYHGVENHCQRPLWK